MKRKFWQTLAWKLTLAFVLVSALSLGAVGVIATVITRAEFNTFITDQIRDDTVLQVQNYVQAKGSVQGFQLSRSIDHGEHGPPDASQAAPSSERGPYVVLDAQRRAVYATSNLPAGTALTGERAEAATPVRVNGRTVAYVAPTGIPQQLDERSQMFLDRTLNTVRWAMLAATLAAVLMGLWISRALLSPVRILLGGIHQMRRGQAPTAAPPRRTDEFGEVLTAFHDMQVNVLRGAQAQRQLTANIAHDINTPMTVILGTLGAMIEGAFSTTTERLTRLHREAQHVTRLVEDLRFLALADAGELKLGLKPADVIEVIGHAVDGVRELALRQGVTLDLQQEGPLVAPIDARRIIQVAQNLLSNALSYTPPGGKVQVTVQLAGDKVQVTVQDTGSGIAPKDLPLVFDRLYRADEARAAGGSGLGLTICKSIVEGHGGTIHIESTLGKGTCVVFTVPRDRVASNVT